MNEQNAFKYAFKVCVLIVMPSYLDVSRLVLRKPVYRDYSSARSLLLRRWLEIQAELVADVAGGAVVAVKRNRVGIESVRMRLIFVIFDGMSVNAAIIGWVFLLHV